MVSQGLWQARKRASDCFLMVATGASPWYHAPHNREACMADSLDGESLSKGNTHGAHVLVNRHGIQLDLEHVWE